MNKKTRTRVSNLVGAFLMGMFLSLSFQSCSNDDPAEPENELEHKLHEDPSKMVVELVECHLHQDWRNVQKYGGTHQNMDTKSKYLRRIQTLTYKIKQGEGWKVAEGSKDTLYVQQNVEYNNPDGTFSPAPVYMLFIHYYNVKGDLIDGEFVENGQNQIHQHFFTPVNVEPTFDGVKEDDDNDPQKLMEYLYTDTDPWNKTVHDDDAKLVGLTDPIGFKGVVRFLKARKQFDLKIRLFHGFGTKKNPVTDDFDPYYKPSAPLIQRGAWDVNINIPVVIFRPYGEYIDDIQDPDPTQDFSKYPEDSLSETSKRTLHSFMHTFHLTWTEALQEYFEYLWGDKDNEAGKIWL